MGDFSFHSFHLFQSLTYTQSAIFVNPEMRHLSKYYGYFRLNTHNFV